ncbi:MAG: zf-HC2 domain-containing protein [Candidatus Aquilonibacter sp.]
MRCSSCEPLLDRYIEGTLTPREMTRVTAHLHACPHCESLLTELRVVDALLATTAPMELAPNFTFAVMAEARSTQVHVHRKLSVWAVLTFYIIGTWIALSGVYAFLGGRIPYLASTGHALAKGSAQSLAALSATAQSVSPATPVVFASAIAVLLLDSLLVIATVFVYRAVRARLAAHLDRSEAL